jgi:hypothetical protein
MRATTWSLALPAVIKEINLKDAIFNATLRDFMRYLRPTSQLNVPGTATPFDLPLSVPGFSFRGCSEIPWC